ncbi:hypothetical protein [Streptomyces sp. NPDC020362]|uniref:hypothetical protein n=1 Tax=Streptomyces sp. NPDC020362 TaxID=3154486 RepID=UPI0033E1A915
MREGAHAPMASADPRTPTDPESWPRCAELYTHVIASGAIDSDQPWVRQLVMNIAKYLYHWQDHGVSLDFSQTACNAWAGRRRRVRMRGVQQSQLLGLPTKVVGLTWSEVGVVHEAAG